LGAILLAIKIQWGLRKHAWFWATIVLILVLHIPLLFIVPWQGKTHVRVYGLPIGIADFLIVQEAVGLAGKVFSKHSSSNGSL
jgi:membrane-anchored protein YejM (alkaline phosphatase superfamily)